MRYLSPAEYVIHRFKGVGPTARALGLHRSTVSKWQTMEGIPGQWLKPILEKARERKLDITAEDLIMGRDVETKMIEVVA